MHDRFPKQIINGALFIIVTQKAGRWRLYVKIWIHITVERSGHGKLCSSSLSCHVHIMHILVFHWPMQVTWAPLLQGDREMWAYHMHILTSDQMVGVILLYIKSSTFSYFSTSQFVLLSLEDYFLCLCQNPLPINGFPEHILPLIPYPQLCV